MCDASDPQHLLSSGNEKVSIASQKPFVLCMKPDEGQGPREPMTRQTSLNFNQEIAAIMTDEYVEQRLTPHLDEYMIAFLHAVQPEIDRINGGLSRGERTFLLYKGGNVFVDYFQRVLNPEDPYLPMSLKQLLKRSDTDFQVVFEPPELFDRIHAQVKGAMLTALYKFRAWLSRHPTLRLAPNITKSAFKKIAKVCTKHGFTLTRAPFANPRPDFLILDPTSGESVSILPKDERLLERLKTDCRLALLPLAQQTTYHSDTNVTSNAYVTLNNSLKFIIDGNVSWFDLIRLKGDMVMRVEGLQRCIHVPYELIDISLSHPDDFKLKLLHRGDDKYATRAFDEKHAVAVPSLSYIIDSDLSNILFGEQEYPWLDVKYQKRMLRFLLGRMMLALEGVASYGERAAFFLYIVQLMTCVLKVRHWIAYNPTAESSPDYRDMVALAEVVRKRHRSLLPVIEEIGNTVFRHINDVFKKVTTSDRKPDVIKSYRLFLSQIVMMLGQVSKYMRLKVVRN